VGYQDDEICGNKNYTDAKLLVLMNSLDLNDGLPQTLEISEEGDTQSIVDNPADGSNSTADGDEITVDAMNNPDNSDFSDDEASFSGLSITFDGDELSGDVNACYCKGLSEAFGGGNTGKIDTGIAP